MKTNTPSKAEKRHVHGMRLMNHLQSYSGRRCSVLGKIGLPLVFPKFISIVANDL
jgi:hypothetical protein